ncbi:FecCD family ABC transporter permease, partial [Halorientalis brevis]
MSRESHSDGSKMAAVRALLGGWRELFDRQLTVVIAGSIAIFAVAGLIQIRFGSYEMSFGQVVGAIFDPAVITKPRVLLGLLLGWDFPSVATTTLIVWQIRIPRVIVGACVGASLAVAGAIFQAVTRNELASPSVLGVSHGAGLAVLIVLVLVPSLSAYLPLVAALGGTVAFLLVYAIAWKGGTSPVRLVLAGVVVATISYSLQQGLFFFAGNTGIVQQALAWLTGSLTGKDWSQVRLVLPWTIGSLALALAGARQLNVLVLGEETASSLGMSVERVRFGMAAVAIVA